MVSLDTVIPKTFSMCVRIVRDVDRIHPFFGDAGLLGCTDGDSVGVCVVASDGTRSRVDPAENTVDRKL